MPIKPENRVLYPRNWPEIRERILLRAGHACEWTGCGCLNYSVGYWRKTATGYSWEQWRTGCGTFAAARQYAAELFENRGDLDTKPTVIVLTIAHLDHDPTNCAPENLRAMCQRHHLAHDQALHLAHAQETRRAKSGNLELF